MFGTLLAIVTSSSSYELVVKCQTLAEGGLEYEHHQARPKTQPSGLSSTRSADDSRASDERVQ